MGTEEEISELNPEIVSSQPSVDRRKLFRRLVALAGLGITGALLSQDKTGLLPRAEASNPTVTTSGNSVGQVAWFDSSNDIIGSGPASGSSGSLIWDGATGLLTVSQDTLALQGTVALSVSGCAKVSGGLLLGSGTQNAFGINASQGAPGVALIAGTNTDTSTSYGVGLFGQSNSPNAIGVKGDTPSGTGNSVGVLGQTSSSNGVGVYGLAGVPGAIPVFAQGASGGYEEIKFIGYNGTQPSRIHATGDGINRFAVNQSYDGANFNLDNTADNGVSFLINSNPSASGIFAIQYIPAGSNPATSRVKSYMFMKSNGNVGIGTTNPAYLLDVAGACHATSFPTSSDMRFKEDIQPIDNALDKVLRLNGVYFKWNQLHRDVLKRDNTEARQVGLVAQQVKEIIPEIVSEWADEGAEDYLAVDYSRLTAVTIEAIKELKAENNALRDRIGALERKLAAS